MGAIYCIDSFNTDKFEGLTSPTETELSKCISQENLLDDKTKSEVCDRRIFSSQQKMYKEGIIDHLIYILSDKGPLGAAEKEVLLYLMKLSEHHGNLVKRYGQEDPYFFGFLTLKEVKKLQKHLAEVSLDEDIAWEEESELLQEVLNKALDKKTGIIYWMLP